MITKEKNCTLVLVKNLYSCSEVNQFQVPEVIHCQTFVGDDMAIHDKKFSPNASDIVAAVLTQCIRKSLGDDTVFLPLGWVGMDEWNYLAKDNSNPPYLNNKFAGTMSFKDIYQVSYGLGVPGNVDGTSFTFSVKWNDLSIWSVNVDTYKCSVIQ